MTKVYDRKIKKVIDEEDFGGAFLDKIYSSRILTWIMTGHFISFLYGLYNKSSASKKAIEKFIEDNNINMDLYKRENYKSFNEFFIRKLDSITIDNTNNVLISPVQGKLLVYSIDNHLDVKIKNNYYNLNELFAGEDLSDYKDGLVLVFRLSVSNYHRFHYIDDGFRIKRKKIRGKLHTVRDVSSKYKIYKDNYREYSILNTKKFGNIIYMEVGAVLVGKIINYNYFEFKRGEEKGYFLPGGSSVVLVVNGIKIDDDIFNNSLNGIETIVNVGERIGVLK